MQIERENAHVLSQRLEKMAVFTENSSITCKGIYLRRKVHRRVIFERECMYGLKEAEDKSDNERFLATIVQCGEEGVGADTYASVASRRQRTRSRLSRLH